jgi:hypothetical protein
LIAALRRAYALLLRRYSRRRLQLEWADERLRAQAAQGGERLVRYLAFFERMVHAAATVYPTRWHVPGKSRSELIADLRAEVWIALHGESLETHARVGVAASLCLARAVVRRWKKQRHIVEIHEMMDPAPLADLTAADQREPEQLAALLQAESARTAHDGLKRVKDHASRIQRSWLAAMELDVRSYGTLNMDRVARQLGRGRSAGARMRATFRAVFARLTDE